MKACALIGMPVSRRAVEAHAMYRAYDPQRVGPSLDGFYVIHSGDAEECFLAVSRIESVDPRAPGANGCLPMPWGDDVLKLFALVRTLQPLDATLFGVWMLLIPDEGVPLRGPDRDKSEQYGVPGYTCFEYDLPGDNLVRYLYDQVSNREDWALRDSTRWYAIPSGVARALLVGRRLPEEQEHEC